VRSISGLIVMCGLIFACAEKTDHVSAYLQDTLKGAALGPKLAIIPIGIDVVGGENFRSFKNQTPQHKVIST
jgi:hypothetical protein